MEYSSNAAADHDPNVTSGPRQPLNTAPLNMPVTVAVCVAGLLVPGLGHILLRRWGRGLILGACILAMFVLGAVATLVAKVWWKRRI